MYSITVTMFTTSGQSGLKHKAHTGPWDELDSTNGITDGISEALKNVLDTLKMVLGLPFHKTSLLLM
jgi:hypothetical protein